MLRRSLISALAGLAILAACGGDDESPTGLQANVAGVYTLRTINGQPLPVTIIQVGSDRLEVTESTLTLNADMSYTEVTNFRITESGVVTNEPGTTLGSYTRVGNLVTFVDASDGTSYTATWDGDRQLTQSAEGITLIYRK